MITVIGAGAWGTALSLQLAKNHNIVNLWDVDNELISSLQRHHSNERYLPEILFPDNLIVHSTLDSALKNTNDILLVIPSHAFFIILMELKSYVNANIRIAWGTKGLISQTNQLLHQAVQEILGFIPMAAVSGPSFAKEVALELPTALTVASNDKRFAYDLSCKLHSPKFRIYTSEDLIGVEVGGAVKNVLAIAVGISDGMGLGANARSALITRGLTEMTRLGEILGGRKETFMGLTGLGDLVLTCTDNQSRNRRLGLLIGSGKSLPQAQKELGLLAEGISNAKSIFELAQSKQVEMPIVEQVYKVIYQNISPLEALKNLLNRAPKTE